MASMFTGARQLVISHSSFTINEHKFDNALKELSLVTAHSALHDSAERQDAHRCYIGTRTLIMQRLVAWICREEERDTLLLWMYGAAGAGKSAIMQTLVDACFAAGLILGSFFFSRFDSSRNNAEALIPTLAYQVACRFPDVMEVLERNINHDPLIFKRSIATQAMVLLVEPLRHLVRLGILPSQARVSPHVFVIDALDECQDKEKQSLIIDVITDILYDHRIPVLFLISSRPDQNIRSALSRAASLHISSSLLLRNDYETENDILQFVKESFLEIRTRHPFRTYLPRLWPSPNAIRRLVERSSGNFVYASVAMKYIASPQDSPSRSLRVILGLQEPRRESPFDELDALYRHIFDSAKYVEQALAIIAHCLLTPFHNSVHMICFVLGFSLEDIHVFLADMRSLVTITATSSSGNRSEMVQVKHASLVDFLLNRSRSQSFHIDKVIFHTWRLKRYLQLISHLLTGRLDNRIALYQRTGIIKNFNISAIVYSMPVATPDSQLKEAISNLTPEAMWRFCTFQEVDKAQAWMHYGEYVRALHTFDVSDEGALYLKHLAAYCDIFSTLVVKEDQPCTKIILPLIFSGFPPKSAVALMTAFSHEGTDTQIKLVMDLSLTLGLPNQLISPTALPVKNPTLIDPKEATRTILCMIIKYSSGLTDGASARTLHTSQSFIKRIRSPVKLLAKKHSRSLRRPSNARHEQKKFAKLRLIRTQETRKTPHTSLRHKMRARGARWRIVYSVLFDAIGCLLRRADCSEELARYTRRMLPQHALLFPEMVKKARTSLDSYTARVHEGRMLKLKQRIYNGSVPAIFEKIGLFGINDMD